MVDYTITCAIVIVTFPPKYLLLHHVKISHQATNTKEVFKNVVESSILNSTPARHNLSVFYEYISW